MAALSVVTLGMATMEMRTAAHSLSGDGYFRPYQKVRNVPFVFFIVSILLVCFLFDLCRTGLVLEDSKVTELC